MNSNIHENPNEKFYVAIKVFFWDFWISNKILLKRYFLTNSKWCSLPDPEHKIVRTYILKVCSKNWGHLKLPYQSLESVLIRTRRHAHSKRQAINVTHCKGANFQDVIQPVIMFMLCSTNISITSSTASLRFTTTFIFVPSQIVLKSLLSF